jgi:hypothetical protein
VIGSRKSPRGENSAIRHTYLGKRQGFLVVIKPRRVPEANDTKLSGLDVERFVYLSRLKSPFGVSSRRLPSGPCIKGFWVMPDASLLSIFALLNVVVGVRGRNGIKCNGVFCFVNGIYSVNFAVPNGGNNACAVPSPVVANVSGHCVYG